ncbi:MAG: hypothetical protein IPL61_04985 [Myxococcales bacterium]|nr:hypothetical protein [Myxococcales bacterium]
MRVAVLLVVLGLAAVGAPVRPARADPTSTIAVIPLVAERRLALYGAPVASELATALRTAGYEVVLVSDVAVVPSRAWLVVDGRLVAGAGRGDRKAVTIELRIRDPEHGVDVQRLASRASALASIDAATRDLAVDLTAAIATAAAARARALAPPVAPIVVAADPDAPPPPPPPPPIDHRPGARLVVRGRPLHDRAGADLDVAALTRPALAHLAERLGYRPGDDPAAELVITSELVWVAAGFEGEVPVGRGRARVMVARAGRTIFDRVVRTDTVVGSRGDRVDTVVRQIAAQAVDVVLPRIREQLEAAR